jgi:ABC transporter substrate binding protein
LRESAGRLGVSLDVLSVTGNNDVESFFARIHERKAERPDAVWFSAVALSGSLVAGPHLQLTLTSWRRMGRYVGKLLQGSSPSQLPVEQVSHIELAINVRRAKALGLTVPPSLLSRADEVIQ